MGFEFFAALLRGVFKTIFVLYWIAAIAALWGIWRSSWIRPVKVGAFLFVGGLMFGWPAKQWYDEHQRKEALMLRHNAAVALYEERCKTAGEKIYKTAEGVDGFYLVKVRKYDPYYSTNQNAEDPYGRMGDSSGDEFILSFLQGRDAMGVRSRIDNHKPGYRYVEAIDHLDGKRYRYIGEMSSPKGNDLPQMTFRKELASGPMPRYAVDFEDLTTPDERMQWIAGGALRVIDLETNEVMAERIGYMVDRGLGAKGGFRSPWAYAASEWSCPQPRPARDFIEKVLKIREQ